MISFLALVFLGMFVYGIVVGLYGAAILSLIMCAFTIFAGKQLRKRDIEYYTHPRSARQAQRPTSDALADHDTEGS